MGSHLLPQESTTEDSRMTLVAVLVVTCCLLFSPSQGASITEDQDNKCKDAAEQAGVDLENFKYNVGHVIHSLTVEDVRFFFDENFPVDNDIPTVNTNLTGTPVLPYVPSFPSKFKFPLGSTLDRILLNNDDPKTFFDRGSASLEELGHAAHMLEMLFAASKTYKTLENVDIDNTCPCLVNEAENGIIDELEYIAHVARFETDPKKSNEEQGIVIADWCTFRTGRAALSDEYQSSDKYTRKKNYLRHQRKINVCPGTPKIKDSESWKIFKTDIAGPMEDDGTPMSLNVAFYLYCKIAMLSK